MQISVAARNAACDAIVDLLDAGSGAATLEIWEAVAGANPPALPTTTISDDDTNYKLLAVLTFSDPAFGSAANGVATASSITQDSSVNKSGTAEFWRAKDSDGTCRLQGSCGTSGADLNFNTVTFVAGGTCQVSSFTVTQPAGTG
jgi:hypothetical protein